MSYEEVFERLSGETKEASSEGTDEEDEWGESEESEEEQIQPEVVQEVEEGAEGESKGQKQVIPTDLEGVLELLDAELPAVPPKPVVEQINPPGTNLPRMLFGKYMETPEGEGDSKKKKKAAKKAPAAAVKEKVAEEEP